MPFSSLPPELVHQVIESTVPLSFHSTTYNERQRTLRRFSLVSRQFRSIAQPLLLEIAWIKNDDQLKLILGDSDGGDVVTRQLILRAGLRALSSDLVGDLVGGAQNLHSLCIRSQDCEVIDVGALSSCKNLVNLQLAGDSLNFLTHSLNALPSLQTFSLDFETAWSVFQLLDSRKLPALKALGLEAINLPDELRELERTQIKELLPQLDALCIELDLYQLAKDTLLLNLEPRTLVNTEIDQIKWSPNNASFSTIQHLRIDIYDYTINSGRLNAIQVLLRFLQSVQQSKPRQLRSIYLDPKVQPIESDDEDIRGEFRKLEENCREAGIDLVFESQALNYGVDPYISREFYRRQRKRRQEQE
ncbi:hypothetical protein JCM5350_000145 [Sporobolomyces pararoseus]